MAIIVNIFFTPILLKFIIIFTKITLFCMQFIYLATKLKKKKHLLISLIFFRLHVFFTF